MANKFKWSLFGFCREDVLAYINTLSANYAATLSEKEERIRELLHENAELRRELKQGEQNADE